MVKLHLGLAGCRVPVNITAYSRSIIMYTLFHTAATDVLLAPRSCVCLHLFMNKTAEIFCTTFYKIFGALWVTFGDNLDGGTPDIPSRKP